MNKNLLILFCLFSLMQVSRAQDPIFGEPQHSTLSADSLSDVVGLIPESLDANVDSLLHSWHVQYFSKVDEYCHDDAENVYFPDSVYEERLERLPSVIRLPYNEVVRDCIDLYAGRKRDLVRYMLGMALQVTPSLSNPAGNSTCFSFPRTTSITSPSTISGS